MSERSLLRAAVAAVASTAALLLPALPAQAAAELEINYVAYHFQWWIDLDAEVSTDFAAGAFDDDGDLFYLKDTAADHMRVAIHWRLGDGSRRGLCIAAGGRGHKGVCNKNLPEDRRVELRVGRCDGDAHSCEAVSHYEDWSPFTSTSTS